MLKAPTKKKSNANIQLIERIAHETRSETLARLQASAEGLSTARAAQNREEYGENKITFNTQASKWKMLFESIVTPFTLVLIILTILTVFTNYIMVPQNSENNYIAIVMLIMLLISVTINFVQKIRMAKVVDDLLENVTVTTNIRRDGEGQELPTDEVVVGDVINLSAGDMIPADMRLLTSKDLFCTASFVNGNSEPIEKVANYRIKPGKKNNYLDFPNILYEGTTIVSGSGTGIVFAVGNQTLFGEQVRKIARKKSKQNLFDRQLHRLARILIVSAGSIIPLLFLINGFTKGNWGESLVFALAAAVGLTPEMLPVIVNSNLTRGTLELFKHHIFAKNINTIQTLGAIDTICIDKTGTLTQNKVMLERHYDLAMRETPRILKLAYLNANYQTGVKDLIDKAIIDAASDELDTNEIQRDYNKIDEIPFDYSRKRMSVVVVDNDEHHGQHLLVTKGAARGMLGISSKVEIDGQIEDLTPEWKEKILDQINELNDDGLRVLLLAYKANPAPVGEFSAKDEDDLTIVGYIAYLDPPKESTKSALENLKKDNVNVKIFTGDNEAVTRAICLQVGLNVDTVYDGRQIEEASAEELAQMVEECNIFVHLTPTLRTKVINALKKNGHTVGYMGDGNKDVYAMRVSDVSFSTNRAVDIAKESADLILKEKDLNVVNQSMIIGRKTFSNTMKYIKMILTTNFGSLISMIISSLVLPFLPLLPLQILLIDLLYSISCLTIPFDRVSKDYTKRPQTWSIKKWPSFVLHFGPLPAIIDFVTMAALYYWICPGLAGNNHLEFISIFYSGLFIESIWTRTMVFYNLRDERFPFVHQHPSAISFWGTSIIAVLATFLASLSSSSNIGFGILSINYLWFMIIIELVFTVITTLMKWIYLKKETF